jgi:hypothetical protein
MGYWKREYTERRNGKPLFLPETKTEAAPPPADEEPGESQPDESQPDESVAGGTRPLYACPSGRRSSLRSTGAF